MVTEKIFFLICPISLLSMSFDYNTPYVHTVATDRQFLGILSCLSNIMLMHIFIHYHRNLVVRFLVPEIYRFLHKTSTNVSSIAHYVLYKTVNCLFSAIQFYTTNNYTYRKHSVTMSTVQKKKKKITSKNVPILNRETNFN